MAQEDHNHYLQIAFQDQSGAAICNAKYSLIQNGIEVSGVTDSQGYSELLQGNAPDPVEVWFTHNAKTPFLVGKATMRNSIQKPCMVARCQNDPKSVQSKTEDHCNGPRVGVDLKKFSVQFNVLPTPRPGHAPINPFSCSGWVSYRLVQDGKVLAEGKTKGPIERVFTASESEVSLYIAGDKRYKVGEAYTPEMNAGLPPTEIPPWRVATPSIDYKKVENFPTFSEHDWVDVSKIYNKDHPDVIPESEGIYMGTWTPPAKLKDRHRRYVVKVGGKDVELLWIEGACDRGLQTGGVTTFTTVDPDTEWYMKVDQVISRTHPKVFKALFAVIKELNLTSVHIVSSWRPGIGSSAHRQGQALDITHVETAEQKEDARDNLPGGNKADETDNPTTAEPELIKKVRLALYNQTEVEQIFTPWHGMFSRNETAAGSFKNSYVLQVVPPAVTNQCESDKAIKERKDIEKANKDSGVSNGESGTFAGHRNHLHFHIKLG